MAAAMGRGPWAKRAAGIVLAAMWAAVLAPYSAREALSLGTDWSRLAEAGHTSAEAEAQRPAECEGIFGIPFGTDPGWVRVGGSPSPTTPFVHASGQILTDSATGFFEQQAFVTHTDFPTNHFSHDVNAFLAPDPGSRHLLSTGSFEEGVPNEHGKLELEWERGGVPPWAYPSNGDRVDVWGTHIFDCGHGDTWAGGADTYRTEIHPPVGWVLHRNTADADGLPDSEDKRTRDWRWYDSTDHQGAAATLPDTGLLNTPVQATVADAFFSSFGGNIVESLNGCNTDDDDTPCTQESEWRQNLLQQDYTFFVAAPPRPSVGSDPAGPPNLVWSAEDRCATVPASPGNPPGDDIDDVFEAGFGDSTADHIGEATCGTIPHVVTLGADANGTPGIHVTVKASSAEYPENGYVAFAKRYRVAWDHAPAGGPTFYRVDFNTLRVWNDSEGCGDDGEWVLSLRANDAWIHPVHGSGEGGKHFWEDEAVDDGLCDAGYGVDYKDYTIGDSLTIGVAPGEKINIWARGKEVDPSVNDWLPVVNDFRTGPGSYSTRTGRPDGDGDYELFYTISEVPAPRPTAGSLHIGVPQYGPNADTEGATRIAAATPVTLDGTDGSRLQYRFWPTGTTPPSMWRYDDSAPFSVDLAGAGDGTVVLQYAPVSAAGVVAERRSVLLQRDTTTPQLTVPASIVVEATSAAGTTVQFTTSATDSLPGPVTTTCTKQSGDFFPIRTVTPVTCTATDAVGNATTKTFTIEVVSPFGYIPDFAVLAEEWVSLGDGVSVHSGNVGTFDTSGGPPSAPGHEVVVGPGVRMPTDSAIAGETVLLREGAQVGQVFQVDGLQAGVDTVYTKRYGYVPLFLGMPEVPAFTAGLTPVNLSGPAAVLAPGQYGAVSVKPNAVVRLTGGTYNLASLDVGPNAQVLAAAPTVLRIAGRAVLGTSSVLQPVPGFDLDATDLVVYVTGTDGPPANPAAFLGRTATTIVANIYASEGTLSFGRQSSATGAFLGKRVDVGEKAVLNLQSGFDNL